jgi:hypothetical protein
MVDLSKFKFMAFSLSKLIGKNKNKSTDSVEAIIEQAENIPFVISENNVLYAGLNELGGYYFFQTVVIGKLRIKTLNGATLHLKAVNFELELKSDMPELESESSSIPKRNITKIDFQVEEANIETLKKIKVTSIQLKTKKQDVLFTKYEDGSSGDEEE